MIWVDKVSFRINNPHRRDNRQMFRFIWCVRPTLFSSRRINDHLLSERQIAVKTCHSNVLIRLVFVWCSPDLSEREGYITAEWLKWVQWEKELRGRPEPLWLISEDVNHSRSSQRCWRGKQCNVIGGWSERRKSPSPWTNSTICFRAQYCRGTFNIRITFYGECSSIHRNHSQQCTNHDEPMRLCNVNVVHSSRFHRILWQQIWRIHPS